MPTKKRNKDKTIMAALIGAFSVILASLIPLILSHKDQHEPTGSIVIPKDGDTVKSVFQVSGELANIPKGHQIRLAIEKDNLIWPKEPAISSADHIWSRTINESGTKGKGTFSLSLLCVPPKGQKVVENWFETGKLTGEYPGLKEIKEAFRLDIVNNLKLAPEKIENTIVTDQMADLIVYITKTGECYHREDCSALRRSKIAIKLSEAKRRGLKPCKRCKPPE